MELKQNGRIRLQLMSVTVLIIFVLIISEFIVLVSLGSAANKLSTQTASLAETNKYGSVLTTTGSDFARSSLKAAIYSLSRFEYNSSFRNGNFISNLSASVSSLMINGTLSGVTARSTAANQLLASMSNATFTSYNSAILKYLNLSNSNISISETKPVIYQNNPYTIGVFYYESITLNNSGNIYSYSIPINVSISLNGTPDLFSAQRGSLNTVQLHNLPQLSPLSNSLALSQAPFNSFVYGTVYTVASGAGSCPSVATPKQFIIVTSNAAGLSGCQNSFGGIISSKYSSVPTIPYLTYPASANVFSTLMTGIEILLYKPTLNSYQIGSLTNFTSSGYYLASPYSSSYQSHSSGDFGNSSIAGLASFSPYDLEVVNAMQQSSLVANTNFFTGNSFTISAWVYWAPGTTFNGVGSSCIKKGYAYSGSSGTDSQFGIYSNWCPGAGNIINTWYLSFGNDDLSCTAGPTAGKWYQFAASWNKTTDQQIIWVNGTPNCTRISNGPLSTLSTMHMLNSTGTWASNGPLQGYISNIQLYSSSLYPPQIYQIYQQGITGIPVSNTIEGWWPLNGNTNDFSGANVLTTTNNINFFLAPNYTRDSLLKAGTSLTTCKLPGILQCTSSAQCSSSTVPSVSLSQEPLEYSYSTAEVVSLNQSQNSLIYAQLQSFTANTFKASFTAYVSNGINGPLFGVTTNTLLTSPLWDNAIVSAVGNTIYFYSGVGTSYLSYTVPNAGFYNFRITPNFNGAGQAVNYTLSIGNLKNLAGLTTYSFPYTDNLFWTTYIPTSSSRPSGVGANLTGFIGNVTLGSDTWPLDGNPTDYGANLYNATTNNVIYIAPTWLQNPNYTLGYANEWQALGLSEYCQVT